MRIRAVILLTTLVAPAFALAAHAAPALNSQDVTTKVTGKVTQLRVDGDISNITVTPGRASSVVAHLEWTLNKPTVTISMSDGVLNVKARCNDQLSQGPVRVGLVNFCVDDLHIVVPAAASLVVGSEGAVNVAQFTGPVDLRGGRVTATDVRTQLLRVSGDSGATLRRVHASFAQVALSSGNVDADQLQGRSLSLSTGNGNVMANDVTAATFSVSDSSGNVTASRVKAESVDLSAGNGFVNVTDVRAPQTTLVSASGNVNAQRVTGARLDVSADNGNVVVNDNDVASTTATSRSGNVTVQQLRGKRLDASSGNGTVTVADVHVRTIKAHSASGNVSAQDLDAPDVLIADSDNGSVNVRVPSGRYYVQAGSDNGSVHVTGLTVDRFAKRELTAMSQSGNVTVTGV